jgi:pimeloyl-ACP methyl ester carboxylesterase
VKNQRQSRLVRTKENHEPRKDVEMKTLRTPDERFENLPGYPYEPNYIEVPDGDGGTLRIHYVDAKSRDAEPVLLMHGEPSWSYLYRKMIPIIVDAGYLAVAPDLAGFGRSDKPAERTDYTFEKPFLTAFSDKDPVTAGGDKVLQKLIPGARGQPHTTIKGGWHFLQEDCGEEFARVVVDFIAKTSN